MKAIKFFKIASTVTRYIVQGITGYFWNIYKAILFVRMCSIFNKWPDDIKLPVIIAAIDKQ